jgi:hypothetical protein
MRRSDGLKARQARRLLVNGAERRLLVIGYLLLAIGARTAG